MTSACRRREDPDIRKLAGAVAVLAAATVGAAQPAAAATLTSVTLQKASEVQEVAFDGLGNAWVTGKGPAPNERPSLFKVTPAGVVTRFDLSTAGTVKPQGIVYAPDGFLYVCVPTDRPNREGFIAKVDPENGTVTQAIVVDPAPWPAAATDGCWDLTPGPADTNRIYFSGRRSQTVGWVDLRTGASNRVVVPEEGGEGSRRPVGIGAGPDRRIYFTLYDADAIARVDANLGSYKRENLGSDVRPRDVTAWTDGNLWVTEENGSALDRVTIDLDIQRFPFAAEVQPNRIVAAPDGNLWFSAGGERLARYTPAGVTSFYQLPAGSLPRGPAIGPKNTIWLAGEGSGVLYGLPLDLAPLVSASRAVATTAGQVTIGVDVDARGVASSFAVDFGPTAFYGTTVGPLDAGSFDGAARREVVFERVPPGTYHFRVRAGNDFGDYVGEDQTVVVPRPQSDRDGDGIPDGTDCAPDDPTRSQLLPEIPGNAKDEDCDGIPQPFPVIGAQVSYRFEIVGRGLVATRMIVTALPPGGRIEMTCKASKKRRSACPFRRFQKRYASGKQSVSLLKRFKKRSLPPGTLIKVRLLHDEQIGLVRRLKIKKGPKLKDSYVRCLVPGDKKPTPCPT